MNKLFILLLVVSPVAWASSALGVAPQDHQNKPAPSKPATTSPAPKPVPPPHHEAHHEERSTVSVLPRLIPVTKPSTTSTDPAECLRIGGTGQRNEHGKCLGWDGKPL